MRTWNQLNEREKDLVIQILKVNRQAVLGKSLGVGSMLREAGIGKAIVDLDEKMLEISKLAEEVIDAALERLGAL